MSLPASPWCQKRNAGRCRAEVPIACHVAANASGLKSTNAAAFATFLKDGPQNITAIGNVAVKAINVWTNAIFHLKNLKNTIFKVTRVHDAGYGAVV